MDVAFSRLLSLGLSLEETSRRLATYPADFIGRWDRSRIAEGAWADLLILEGNQQIGEIVIEGEML